MGRMKDPTKMVITPSSGKDVRDTNMLSGLASDNPGRNATNVISKHTGSGPPKDKLGGMPLNG